MKAVGLNCRNGALVALLVLSVGCWEEIRYDPSKYAESTASDSEPISVDPEPPGPEPPQPEPPLPEPQPPVLTPPYLSSEQPKLATRPLAWQLGSEWSMAAALHAKGLGTERWTPAWNQAVAAAELLQVELPPLPDKSGKPGLSSKTIVYLLDTAGPNLSQQLDDRHDARHAALVELAIKTNTLLLIYSPHNEQMGPMGVAIERAAKAADLPATLWQPLATQLTNRAPFAEVKPAVFQMHQQVATHLAADPH